MNPAGPCTILDPMRVFLVYHPADADFAAGLSTRMAQHRFETRTEPEGSDLAVLLVSKAAFKDGLGAAPAQAMAAGLRVLPVVLGDDAVPLRFPVHAKHIPHANETGEVVRILEDHRKVAGQKIADSKQELFGYGVLLALLGRSDT